MLVLAKPVLWLTVLTAVVSMVVVTLRHMHFGNIVFLAERHDLNSMVRVESAFVPSYWWVSDLYLLSLAFLSASGAVVVYRLRNGASVRATFETVSHPEVP